MAKLRRLSLALLAYTIDTVTLCTFFKIWSQFNIWPLMAFDFDYFFFFPMKNLTLFRKKTNFSSVSMNITNYGKVSVKRSSISSSIPPKIPKNRLLVFLTSKPKSKTTSTKSKKSSLSRIFSQSVVWVYLPPTSNWPWLSRLKPGNMPYASTCINNISPKWTILLRLSMASLQKCLAKFEISTTSVSLWKLLR